MNIGMEDITGIIHGDRVAGVNATRFGVGKIPGTSIRCGDFAARFGPSMKFAVELGYYQVDGHGGHATAKVVLPAIFTAVEEPEAS